MSDREITAVATASHGNDFPLCRELTVKDTVDAIPIKTAPFDLPEGWIVKKVPRDRGTEEHKLYYEPGTGRRFESLRAVEMHLQGADCTPLPQASKPGSCFEKYYERRNRRKVLPFINDEKYFPRLKHNSSSKALKVQSDAKSSPGKKSIVSVGKSLKLDNKKKIIGPQAESKVPRLGLPDGWLVEEVPRRNTTSGYTQKYYHEPGTGKKFRSLASVKRYLAEAEEDKPLAVMFSIGSPAKKLQLKNTKSREKVACSTFGSATPPAKIKWVLTNCNDGECTFKPSIGEAMVAEPVVRLWASKFMTSFNCENHTTANFVQ